MLAHLKRLSHGTRGIPDQICKKLAVAQHAEYHVFNALRGNNDAKEFAEQLFRYNRLPDMVELSNGVSFIGPLKPLTTAIDNVEGFPCHQEENLLVAQRMNKHGQTYHSTSYVRRKKSVSFLIKIRENEQEYFGKVEFFVKQGDVGFAVISLFRNLQHNVCNDLPQEPNDPVMKEFHSSDYLGCHFVAVRRTNQQKLINCSSIVSKVVLVESKENNGYGFVSSVLKCYQHD
jgi:hypothetical protein